MLEALRMNWTSSTPPTLCSISQCKTELDFKPASHWPASLPAVAVNGWVLAGFSQKLVFNHSLSEQELKEKLPSLFHSLHSELSATELERLRVASLKQLWFPFAAIAEMYKTRTPENLQNPSQLPWPGSSQVRWAKHGGTTGIEVKLFVTRPEDLKKYASSFEKIQELLESPPEDWRSKEH
jgi:hypothetical protein